MNVHKSITTAESKRMFDLATTHGEVYTNEAGVQQYISNLAANPHATEANIQQSITNFEYALVQRELTNELWTQNNIITQGASINNIIRVESKEELLNATPVMLNYIFSEPTIYDAYTTGIIKPWSDYTPVHSDVVWETVNTGSCELKDKTITITEYINNEPKLTVDERITILEAQNYVKESLQENGDPWVETIVYY